MCDGVDIIHTGFVLYYGKVSEQYDEDLFIDAVDREVCFINSDYFVEGMEYYFAITATGIVHGVEKETDYSTEAIWNP